MIDSDPSPCTQTNQTDPTHRLLGVKWMQYHGIVDINFNDSTLSVFPYDARTRDMGSTELADLLEDVRPELLARGVPMRQVRLGGGFGVCGHMCLVTRPGPSVRPSEYTQLYPPPNQNRIKQDPVSAIFFVDINLGGPSGAPVPAIVDLGAGAFCFYLYQAPFQPYCTPTEPGAFT